MAKTTAQRQSTYRSKQKLRGVTRMTLNLSHTSARTLRALAREHHKTQSEVLELALLLARQRLAEPTAIPCPVDGARADTTSPDQQASQLIVASPSAPRASESWWPENYQRLLEA